MAAAFISQAFPSTEYFVAEIVFFGSALVLVHSFVKKQRLHSFLFLLVALCSCGAVLI